MTTLNEVVGGFSGAKGHLLLVTAVVATCGFALKSIVTKSSDRIQAQGDEDGQIVSSDWRENSKTKTAFQQRDRPSEAAAMRLGLSFGIAMIVGFLLNTFLRPMLTVMVVTGIVRFPLFNHGIIDPLWENYASAAGEAKVWAMEDTRMMQRFFQGYIPSAEAGLFGFRFGL
jgi:uncharacterized membrane protein (Fun14 family)